MKFLNTFFLCMTLKSGAYFIACLQIFKLIILIVVCSLALSGNENPGEQIFDQYPFYLLGLFLCVVLFISSVLLIIGASRQKSNYILPWILINSIFLVVVASVKILLQADTTIFDNVENYPATYSLLIVKSMISFVFDVYYWLCMVSLYMRIRKTESTPKDDSTSILKKKEYHRIEGGTPPKNFQAV